MQRMHNPEREAKKADRISRSKTFKPRITSTDYDSFTFKCRLCMMGFRRRGMLVSARRLWVPPVVLYSVHFCFLVTALVSHSVQIFPWVLSVARGKARGRQFPICSLLPSLRSSSFATVHWERSIAITFHYQFCFALPFSVSGLTVF